MRDTDNSQWNYTSKTATILMQTIAHIELSMQEGDDSIGTVIETFNTMGKYLDTIQDGVQELAGTRPELSDSLDYVRNHINEAIISMQFYDALTQRLQTVTKGLMNMAELVDDADKRTQESSWIALQEGMLNSCSIQSDTVFLRAICEGKGFEEAHRLSREARQDTDDIELF